MDIYKAILYEIQNVCEGNKCLRMHFDNAVCYNLDNFDDFTIIHAAAWNGHEKCLETLLINAQKATHFESKHGYTPLHITAATGQNDCLRILIQYGADIDTKAEKGLSALHLAALNGNSHCIQTLIENGVEIEALSNEGARALHYAADNGKLACLQTLIDHGADIEARLPNGTRPIHSAAFSGNVKCVQTLLQHGAMVNAKTYEGLTALHVASIYQHPECIKMLLHNGVDVDAIDCHGRTALDLCALKDDDKCVNILRRYKVVGRSNKTIPKLLQGQTSMDSPIHMESQVLLNPKALLNTNSSRIHQNRNISSLTSEERDNNGEEQPKYDCNKCDCKNCITDKNNTVDKMCGLKEENNELHAEMKALKDRVNTLENQKLTLLLSQGNGPLVKSNTGMVSEGK